MWNDGPSVIVVQWVMFGLSCCAIAIRIGACRRPQYGFWWDDFVMFTSMALFLGTCVTGTIALAWGCGKFSNDVAPSMLPQATLMGIIATDLGMFADAVPKIGVALLIIRLFHPKLWIKWSMIAVTLLCLVFTILLVIFSFIQCRPAKYQWNRDTMDGTCWNITVYTDFAFFTGAWTAALDLLLSLYPLFVISQLKMQWRKKLAVMATMSLGFGTFAVTTYKVATQYPKFLHAAYDATKVLANIMLWNALGAGFTIIAGSIPTWGWVFHTPQWKRFLQWMSRGKFSASRNNSGAATPEKRLFNMVGAGRPIPNGFRRPKRDTPPLTFPQRLHYSGGSTPSRTTYQSENSSGGQTRPNSQARPLDSLQQLERDTWFG